MIKVYDFECHNGHRHEAFVPAGQDECECPICGETATKQLAAPRSVLDGVSGHFPGALLKWEERHRSDRPSNKEKEQTT